MTLGPVIDRRSSATIKYTSLARLMRRVQAVLDPAIDKSFGLRAELSSADERDGVFYGELTESNVHGTVIAKLRCMIWSQDLRRIRARFAREGLEPVLQRGTVIGVQCVLQFHPVHGLSVRVLDMDPAFVIGELELRRRRTLANLEQAGLLGRNAALHVPLLPNRIVLITSAQSAACQDFLRTLAERRYGVRVWLADATMQGPDTEASVLHALAVAERLAPELVIVIRGGGSKTDLSWLDSEAIARRIATLSRPVWTGIGHETDRSVLDVVAGQAFRTPTAVAEALAGRLERVGTRLVELAARLRDAFEWAQRTKREQLRQHAERMIQLPRQRIAQRQLALADSRHQLQRHAQTRLSRARASWTVCAHTLHQISRVRLSVAQHALLSHTHWLRRALDTCLRTAVGRVDAVHTQLRHVSLRALERRQDAFTQVRGRLSLERARASVAHQRAGLEQRALLVRAHDPRRALARGFSLTYTASGQLVRSTHQLAPSDTITTQFADGHVVATVRETQQETDDE